MRANPDRSGQVPRIRKNGGKSRLEASGTRGKGRGRKSGVVVELFEQGAGGIRNAHDRAAVVGQRDFPRLSQENCT